MEGQSHCFKGYIHAESESRSDAMHVLRRHHPGPGGSSSIFRPKTLLGLELPRRRGH